MPDPSMFTVKISQ
uniref:Uncharacterized protein n=1 Tax=Arundo donax TaxID=35708 RepID=A0A0A9FVZ7_ARUDO